MRHTHRTRVGGRPVLLHVEGERVVEVFAEGETFGPQAARMVQAMGGKPFGWLPVADAIDHALALLPGTDPQTVCAAVCLPEPNRVDAAKDPGTPRAVLAALTVDRTPRVRSAVAERLAGDRANGDLIEVMLTDSYVEVRRKFATSQHVSVSLLERLAHDPDHLVRLRVARNALTPALVQDLLVDDPHPSPRIELARRDDARPELLARLAADEHEKVRIFVAAHPRTPEAVRVGLLSDRLMMVRLQAVEHVVQIPDGLVPGLLGDASVAVRSKVAARVPVTSEVLERLATDPRPEVRVAAAQRSDLPDAWVVRLAQDSRKEVRLAVAERYDPVEEALVLLLEDRVDAVRKAARKVQRRLTRTR